MPHATLMQVAVLSKLITTEAADNVSSEENIPIVGLFVNTSIASFIGTLAVLHARCCSKSQSSAPTYLLAGVWCLGEIIPVTLLSQVESGPGTCRAAFMPLDCSWPLSKLKAMLDDAHPVLVIWADKECHGELGL